jgi:hypothetical protein
VKSVALFAALAFTAAGLAAQQVKDVPAAVPVAPKLSTADRIALVACEKSKKEARDQFDVSQQQELTIIREWDDAHPGFYIDQQTLAITPQKAPDAPAVPSKAEQPKTSPNAAKK